MHAQNEIRWRGMSSTPSDYSSPDGDTTISQNLICENGELRPIMPPKVAFTIPLGGDLTTDDGSTLSGGGRLFAVHQIGTTDIYIIGYRYTSQSRSVDGYGLFAFTVEDGELQYYSKVYVREDSSAPSEVLPMGNILVISYTDGLVFARHLGDGYISLGNKPLQLNLGFGLNTVSQRFSEAIPIADSNDAITFAEGGGNISDQTIEDLQEFWDDYWKCVAQVKADNDEGVFMHPFFVRYAYRINTDSGTHTLQSPPILLFPSSRNVAYITNVLDTDIEDWTKWIYYDILFSYGTLFYSVQNSVSELKQLVDSWKDIITEVDICISAPISDIKQDEQLKRCKVVTDATSPMLPVFLSNGIAETFDTIYPSLTALDTEGKVKDSWANIPADASLKWPKNYIDIPKYSDEEMREKVENTSLFYRVATLKLESILTAVEDQLNVENSVFGAGLTEEDVVTTFNESLPISQEVLDSLQQREVLEDDYDSHQVINGGALASYNARLYLANIRKSLFQGYHPDVMFPHNREYTYNKKLEDDLPLPYNYEVYTYYRKNGTEYITKHATNSLDCYTYDYLPFIFVPDVDAYKMVICATKGGDDADAGSGEPIWSREFQLTPHKYLNGSFYYNGLVWDFGVVDNSFTPPAEINPPASLPQKNGNLIIASEVNNPFHFPISGRETIGGGTIRAIASTSVALSQGQFGQFPLYALTDEGTWALSVGDDGRLSAKQPATRDVILDKESLLQMDGALSFVTEQGIVYLSGAESTAVTSILDNPPLNLSTLERLTEMFTALKNIESHKAYWTNCRMAFDYARKRLIVFNSSYEYSYVFSNMSQQWAVIPRKYMYAVNKYPTSLMVGTGPTPYVYDLSIVDEDARVNGFVVSRMIKMDIPDILKTIEAAVHRGTAEISTALYGSIDGKRFYYIASSNGKHLRKLHGTPYKYFVFVIGSANMSKRDYLSATSVTFQTKRTNKLR